jgi:hypothetical protein
MTPFTSDVPTSADTRELQLDIVRAGQPLHIEYITMPVLVDVYLWSRVPGVTEDVCRGGY